MFCEQCGKELPSSAQFCSGCGKAVGAPSGKRGDGRVNRNLMPLGILWAVTGALRILEVFWLFMFGRIFLPAMRSWVPEFAGGFPVARFLHNMIGAAAGFAVVWALLAVVAAWGLLQRESWGRTVALIAGVLALIRIPFGTALGIYTLWVLMPQTSDEEYRQLAGA